MKRHFVLLTFLLLALSLAGCGNQESKSTDPQSSEVSNSEESGSTGEEIDKKESETDSEVVEDETEDTDVAEIPKGEKITILSSSETLTGYYDGEKLNNLPNGYGKFVSETSIDSSGTTLTYEGNWKYGRFDGIGKITYSDGTVTIKKFKDGLPLNISIDDIPDLFTSPNDFENYSVELTGEICSDVKYEDNVCMFYFTLDPSKPDECILAHAINTPAQLKEGDMIDIIGKISKSTSGNDIGIDTELPVIQPTSVTIIPQDTEKSVTQGEKITINLSTGPESGYYEGEIINGLPNGNGKFVSEPFDSAGKNYYSYEGEWKNGIMNGIGKLTISDGDYYISRFYEKGFKYIKIDEIPDLFSTPEKYDSYCIDITGVVSLSSTNSGNLCTFYLTLDQNKPEESFFVYIPNTTDTFEKGDIVTLSGMLIKTFSDNAIGLDKEIPLIKPMTFTNLSKLNKQIAKDEPEEPSAISENESTHITITTSEGQDTGYYEGDMKNGLPHGMGTFTSETANYISDHKYEYKGQWKNGKFDGLGVLTQDTGSPIISNFKEGAMQPMEFDDFPDLFETPSRYVGCYVKFTGHALNPTIHTYDDCTFYFAPDATNKSESILAHFTSKSVEVKKGDIVTVVGLIRDTFDTSDLGINNEVPILEGFEVTIE